MPKRLQNVVWIVLLVIFAAANAGAQKVVSPPQIAPPPVPSQPPSPSGGVSEGGKKQTAPENSPQSSDQDKRGTESSPLAIKLMNTGKSEPEATQEAQRIKEQTARERWATNWSIGLTTALVFAAFLQFSGLVGQIIVYRKQAGIMQKALSATTRAAETAEKSAAATVAQMRAYIGVVPRGVRPFHSGGDDMACDVGFKNVGHLSAQSVSWVITKKFCVSSKLAEFTILPDICDGNVVLPPGIEMRKGLAEPLSKADFAERRDAAEHQWLYVFGRVEYKDGFGKERWSNFCFRYSLAAADSGTSISGDEARYHEHGNSTDEDEK